MKMEQETINRESQQRLSMTEIHTIAAAGREELSSMSEIAGKDTFFTKKSNSFCVF